MKVLNSNEIQAVSGGKGSMPLSFKDYGSYMPGLRVYKPYIRGRVTLPVMPPRPLPANF